MLFLGESDNLRPIELHFKDYRIILNVLTFLNNHPIALN